MKKKKGLNLLWKFASMSLVPLLVLFVIAQFAISFITNTVAEKLVGNMLASNAYAMDEIMMLGIEAYGQEGAQIGEIMEEMKEQTGGVNYALVDVKGETILISTFTRDVPVNMEAVNKAVAAGTYLMPRIWGQENHSIHTIDQLVVDYIV